MSAPRVAVACDWFVKYACAQAAGLARAGAEVLLLCRDHAEEFSGDERERQAALAAARAAGATVMQIPGRQSDPRALAALPALARRVARQGVDIVHAHDGADPRALALLARRPTVLTLHDPVLHPGQPVPALHKRWFVEATRRAWQARARAIVVHSERLRAQVNLRQGQRCVVIPHGAPLAQEPLAPPATPTVGFFGRLAPYKGLGVLARAMPLVWQRRPDVHVAVAGEGSAEFSLHDPRVSLQRRYVPESEIPRLYAASSLTVLPYTQATQSGPGSQAAGYGVPVVASRVGGLPDLVLDDSYLVAPGDERELAGAILRHIDDGPEVRRRVLAEVGRPRSWDAVAARSLELYEAVLGRR